MVSYIQVEGYGLEQGFKGVVSKRPKAQSLQQEDQFFWYEYDRRGGLKSKRPKPPAQQYAYWHRHIAHDSNMKRILPLTEFEKQMGVRGNIPTRWYKGKKYNEKEWNIFIQQFDTNRTGQIDIDYGELETTYTQDFPVHLGQGKYDWEKYWKDHAEKMDLIPVNISELEFKKKHPYCIANNIHGSNCNIESTPELAPPVLGDGLGIMLSSF